MVDSLIDYNERYFVLRHCSSLALQKRVKSSNQVCPQWPSPRILSALWGVDKLNCSYTYTLSLNSMSERLFFLWERTGKSLAFLFIPALPLQNTSPVFSQLFMQKRLPGVYHLILITTGAACPAFETAGRWKVNTAVQLSRILWFRLTGLGYIWHEQNVKCHITKKILIC